MQPQTALQTMLNNRNIRINMFDGHFIGFSKEQRSLFRKQMTPYICLRHLSQLIFAKLSMNIMTLYTDVPYWYYYNLQSFNMPVVRTCKTELTQCTVQLLELN